MLVNDDTEIFRVLYCWKVGWETSKLFDKKLMETKDLRVISHQEFYEENSLKSSKT